MIELRNATKRYETAAGTQAALLGVTASFADGELTAVLGPSGSGKSTLLRLLNRMIEPDEGTVVVDGEDARTMDPIELRRSMGYVIQNVGLFPHMTVAENVAVVPRLLRWPKARSDARVAELLDLVRLPRAFADRRPRELSGGEAQRVGVARALAADPRVLLMDEPFGALDGPTRDALLAEFARIQKELRKTVVFVTHDVGEAAALADRVLVLAGGKVAAEGSPAELARAASGSFAADFLGARMELELLGRLAAADWADFAGAGNGEGALPPGATIRDALARIIASGGAPARVLRENGDSGTVDLATVVRAGSGMDR